jgi:hypothetical protein
VQRQRARSQQRPDHAALAAVADICLFANFT